MTVPYPGTGRFCIFAASNNPLETTILEFCEHIIQWYNSHRRDLPWRNTHNPYCIWISEIILQQTRVAQGYDYYNRFIGTFPDVRSLAQASEDEVLRLWQGLGYYSRARNLHAAAQSMPDGIFPSTYEGVRALKGVGDYTAAAICSIAYNLPYAVVDGNVYRVLSRYFGIPTPIDSTAGKKEFAALAQQLLDRQHPGTYNQGIMDFGALCCTPQNPTCMECPLADSCQALADNQINSLPVKEGKIKKRDRYFTYFWIHSGDCTFLRKRDNRDIWKGLYEFPVLESDTPYSSFPEDAFVQLTGYRPLYVKQHCKAIKHVLSHQNLFADFYEIEIEEAARIEGYKRIGAAELEDYALPRLLTRLIQAADTDNSGL